MVIDSARPRRRIPTGVARSLRVALATLLLGLVLAACSPAAPASTPAAGQEVTIAMGFVPNIQFAPLYVAVSKGYFAEEGIDLSFDYGMEDDIVQLVAANELQFAIASGDQVLLARSRGLPVTYVANWYRRFPVAITSLTLDLADPKVLEGKTVGLPGLFGANYIGWLALAQAAGLDSETIQLEAIGFGQVPVLIEGRVDAAVVYASNEPLLLEAEGYAPSTLFVADYVDLVANGLITNDRTIEEQEALVAGMVRAMVRGIEETLANPDAAFDLVVAEWVPEAGGENAAAQRAVLEATMKLWENPEGVGHLPRSAWVASQSLLLEAGLLETAVPIDQITTDLFVSQASR